MKKQLGLLLFALLFSFCACKVKENADLILLNGAIYTADSLDHVFSAMAIGKDKVMAIGSDKEMMMLKSENTKTIDLGGKFVMPGLNEGHAHFLALGKSMINIDLQETRSWEEIVLKVAVKTKQLPVGAWIEGRGWHQDKWKASSDLKFNGYPYHDLLSAASPAHPVVLYHASGHALIANGKAMELSGINQETTSPVGGRIVKDKQGKLTGVFEENAMGLIERALDEYEQKSSPQEVYELVKKQVRMAVEKSLEYGITSFQDAGSSLKQINLLHSLSEKGEIPIRLNVMFYENPESAIKKMDSLPFYSYNQEMFRAASIKAYVDGALGSYGAWLQEDYADNPGVKGQTLVPVEMLANLAVKAKSLGLQVCMHAIGDKGNNEVLNIYEKAGIGPENRWRIEHAQHLHREDIPRFNALGVIASMQAIHCTSDAPFVVKRLGQERAKSSSYIWRSLLDAGVHFANGTDAPVEKINPFECIYAAITRKRLDNGMEFFPEEKMTRTEALKSYTIWNAYASFEENLKGNLVPGKKADFIVLDKNLLQCPDLEVPLTKVLSVYIDGKKIR
ncbi:MAG: amidohydrolase [Saprospiraceae bacterium]|nr:amidohydrolase [Saprospiraceae bacterium]